ncbi:hypothetical protein LTR16_007651, partial [Cryomyces antarcticus]
MSASDVAPHPNEAIPSIENVERRSTDEDTSGEDPEPSQPRLPPQPVMLEERE